MTLTKNNNFNELIDQISKVHDILQGCAAKSVNQLLTIQNWIFGYYIVEYEQNGEDRAKYGEKLLDEIAKRLSDLKGFSFRQLYLCKDFYLTYSYFLQTVFEKLQTLNLEKDEILQTLSAKLQYADNKDDIVLQTLSTKIVTPIQWTQTIELNDSDKLNPEFLLSRLNFYHRILKCHVLIDSKVYEFDHADAGQMNLYLNYYKANEMNEGDNPPIGIILCADKDDTLVEYSTAGMDDHLFVSKYLVNLSEKNVLAEFIRREIENEK
ncbi:MAG: PDDEXK nuclease domain-containing protein [Bacteroidetes bacterium]|nr:PDDEXK nuclease domain-containing protein [Bacteroidota bacterium]MCL1968323.1 PDDEXK nuclease domain-containing protein [Bacteroidota bacterium]